ncbi:MAG: acyl-CoA thioester hydrolase [Verrucomicrobia bacterium]|jgi:acyl-CoA thioester hydrolase|nr:MAG: acyl-CoA thioester hydrolase [Verrucomicrobiota bacterium]
MASVPAHRFLYRRRIEFAETDMAGIVHFANFFRMMEEAEHAFYRSLGFTVHDFRPGPGEPRIGWPRVHAEADFRLPLEFEEEVEIEVLVEEVRNKSIRYVFRFWKGPETQRRLAATGRFCVVCVRFLDAEARMESIPVPDWIRGLLEAAPAALLGPG